LLISTFISLALYKCKKVAVKAIDMREDEAMWRAFIHLELSAGYQPCRPSRCQIEMNGLREICAVEALVFASPAETLSAPAATSPTPAAADAIDFKIFLLSMRFFSLVDKDSGSIINVMTKVDYF